MKFGLWAPRGGKADESDIKDPFRFSVDIVQAAEKAGFTTALIAQRYRGPDLDAWVLTSALAPHTSSIELLVAVHPGILTPQVVAKMGSTIDQISNGRFAINLVNGWDRNEMQTFGNGAWLERSDSRYHRMAEFIEVVEGLWSERPFQFDGQFFRVEEGGSLPAKPLQKLPPFYAASRSKLGEEIIARLCEEWFVLYEAGHRNFEANVTAVEHDIQEMRRLSACYGRELRFGISAMVVCASNLEDAEAEADRIEQAGQGITHGRSSVLALGAGLVGTPDRVAERIRRYHDVGVGCFMLRFPRMRQGLEQFTRDVIPLLELGSTQDSNSFESACCAAPCRHKTDGPPVHQKPKLRSPDVS